MFDELTRFSSASSVPLRFKGVGWQLKGVKDDSSMSPAQKKAKASEIHQSAKSQISSFLTPEQQKKLAEMRETARDK